MAHQTLRWSIYALFLSVAAVIAMTLVQAHSVPGYFENVIRMGLGYSAPIVSFILLALAIRSWLKFDRPIMRDWRNGLGLSAFVLLVLVYVYRVSMMVWGLMHSWSASSFFLDWYLLSVLATDISFVLAFSLRGNSRLALISAALLMVAWQQSAIYI